MKLKLILIFNILLGSVLYAQNVIPLWPAGKMPNSEGITLDHIEDRERITQVSSPNMLAFFPPRKNKMAAAF